jgi:hypothetical protein
MNPSTTQRIGFESAMARRLACYGLRTQSCVETTGVL